LRGVTGAIHKKLQTAKTKAGRMDCKTVKIKASTPACYIIIIIIIIIVAFLSRLRS